MTVGPFNVTVGEDGTWSLTEIDLSTLPDGPITYSIEVTDAHGNVTTYTQQANKDTIAPAFDVADLDGPINGAAATMVTISGTGDVGAMVTIVASIGEQQLTPPAVEVDGDGNWTVMIDVSTLPDGTITFAGTATDTAGNTAIDETMAEKDTTTYVTINSQILIKSVTSENQANVEIFGTREAGATVVVKVTDGNTTLEQEAPAGGGWKVFMDLSSLNEGPLTIMVMSTDLAGNTATNSLIVQKDTVTEVEITSVPESINPDNQTNTEIGGTGEAGATITLLVSDGVHDALEFSIAVSPGGTWSISGIDVSGLDDGTITYSVTAMDDYLNMATDSAEVLKDTEAGPLTLAAGGDGRTRPTKPSTKTKTGCTTSNNRRQEFPASVRPGCRVVVSRPSDRTRSCTPGPG